MDVARGAKRQVSSRGKWPVREGWEGWEEREVRCRGMVGDNVLTVY